MSAPVPVEDVNDDVSRRRLESASTDGERVAETAAPGTKQPRVLVSDDEDSNSDAVPEEIQFKSGSDDKPKTTMTSDAGSLQDPDQEDNLDHAWRFANRVAGMSQEEFVTWFVSPGPHISETVQQETGAAAGGFARVTQQGVSACKKIFFVGPCSSAAPFTFRVEDEDGGDFTLLLAPALCGGPVLRFAFQLFPDQLGVDASAVLWGWLNSHFTEFAAATLAHMILLDAGWLDIVRVAAAVGGRGMVGLQLRSALGGMHGQCSTLGQVGWNDLRAKLGQQCSMQHVMDDIRCLRRSGTIDRPGSMFLLGLLLPQESSAVHASRNLVVGIETLRKYFKGIGEKMPATGGRRGDMVMFQQRLSCTVVGVPVWLFGFRQIVQVAVFDHETRTSVDVGLALASMPFVLLGAEDRLASLLPGGPTRRVFRVFKGSEERIIDFGRNRWVRQTRTAAGLWTIDLCPATQSRVPPQDHDGICTASAFFIADPSPPAVSGMGANPKTATSSGSVKGTIGTESTRVEPVPIPKSSGLFVHSGDEAGKEEEFQEKKALLISYGTRIKKDLSDGHPNKWAHWEAAEKVNPDFYKSWQTKVDPAIFKGSAGTEWRDVYVDDDRVWDDEAGDWKQEFVELDWPILAEDPEGFAHLCQFVRNKLEHYADYEGACKDARDFVKDWFMESAYRKKRRKLTEAEANAVLEEDMFLVYMLETFPNLYEDARGQAEKWGLNYREMREGREIPLQECKDGFKGVVG